jgi:RNA polymerase sigma factor (TIGR02999 family)
MSDVTQLLHAASQGDPRAAMELLPPVYEELRRLAAHKMAGEAAGHTLQPTALVHEAWLRLHGSNAPQFQNRAHFFAVAAEAMRRILVESARRKLALRHGGGQERVAAGEMEIATGGTSDDQLLAVSDALEKLAADDPVAAEVVKLRFFAGLTNAEAGDALGISERTVKRCWAFARAWLFKEIQRNP